MPRQQVSSGVELSGQEDSFQGDVIGGSQREHIKQDSMVRAMGFGFVDSI